MNLFKKSTAAVALVTLVSSVFTTGVSAYSTSEIEAANTLAQAGVIVDQSANPAAYNLDQNVLRQEIAAVARGIAGLDKKTTCDGVFTDVSATTPNTWACYSVEALADAGLIAKNAQFRPEANISKAEAVGMVVKAAFGDAYAYDASKGTTWQEQVVAFAVANGIVSNFTNYDTAATRGFVFEAGANAMSSTEDEEMNDIICTLLGTCGTEEDNTSEEDDNTTVTTPVVTGGNVEVSLNPASAVNGTQIPEEGTVRFAKVDFTAGSQDVSVNTVEVKSLGLASVPTTTRVFFEKNGKRVSGKAAFSSDRTAVVSFAPALVVKAGSTETLDL
ncbi:S-layer homology domain-containing protein, partial [Candidatus Gracilibacteria bacterium]|nr:S-layer homology domain-containing protein [Candidatus Gracilibacteria bacterium]